MKRSLLCRAAAIAFLAVLCRAPGARASEPGLPLPPVVATENTGIPREGASASTQEADLAAAEKATAACRGETEKFDPTSPGDDPYTIVAGPTTEKNYGQPEEQPGNPLQQTTAAAHTRAPGTVRGPTRKKSLVGTLEADAREHVDQITHNKKELAKKGLAQVSITVGEGQANARQWNLDGGNTQIDEGHAEYTASVGFTNAIEAQVSAVEVKQAVGPARLEADALTAKAGAEIGIDGVGAGVAATLVEAGAQLGPLEGSVGLGVAAEAEFSLHRVHVTLGLGLQASFSIDPVQTAQDLWGLAKDFLPFGHHRKKATCSGSGDGNPGETPGIAGRIPGAR